MFLVTASQVILGTALIMGISALVTVMLRVCSNRRYSRNSQNLSNIPDEFGRVGGTRVSVTSLQQRVMTKMRDRPPRYETRHNYEYQRREGCTRIPILNPAASVAVSEASIPPPAYENSDGNSVSGEVVWLGNLIYKFVLEGEWTSASVHNCDWRHRRVPQSVVYDRRARSSRWRCANKQC